MPHRCFYLAAAASAVLLVSPLAAQDGDRAFGAVEEFFLRKFDQMEKDFRNGKYEKVVSAAEAILELHPGFSRAAETTELKLKAKDRLVCRDYVRGTTVLDRSECMVGEKAAVTFLLKNVHTGRIEIHLDPEGASPWKARNLPFAQAQFRFEERGCFGEVLTDSWSHPVEGVEGLIELDPGETWERRFVLDTGERAPLRATKRTYEISAVIRPGKITAGDKVIYRPIAVEPAVLTVFPCGYRILKAVAGAAVDQALREELAVNLFIAAHFITDQEYPGVLRKLADAAAGDFEDPRMKRAVLAAVAALTGRKVPDDPGLWQRWWEENREELGKGRNG